MHEHLFVFEVMHVVCPRVRQKQLSIDELRMQISQRLQSNAAFSQQVYREQPIIMTGAQLKESLPAAIREARSLARARHPEYRDTAELFYAQAQLLANCEDDFEYAGTFSHYYPTYEDMSNEQLRGYLSWRSKVRQGDIRQTSLSFAYVYLYELLHLVGAQDAQDAYEKLCAFGKAYRRFDARFGRYFDVWHDDFVVYYELDPTLLYGGFAQNDAAHDVLAHRADQTRDELFDALAQLSSYPIKESLFFFEHEEELRDLVTHVYECAARHHDEKLKVTLAAKLAGQKKTEQIRPFWRAVFADSLRKRHAEYKVSTHDTIYCRNGVWVRSHYVALEKPLVWVSQLLETCESILRDAYAYPSMLGRPITTKYLIKAATNKAASLREDARMREARAVRIDMGKLSAIRNAADITCEKLIVDEDEPQAEVPVPVPVQAHEQEQLPLVQEPASSNLSELECELLQVLLEGETTQGFERAHACMASVLIDSINEKLFDEFSDICIDSSDAMPYIIEDYRAELQSIALSA